LTPDSHEVAGLILFVHRPLLALRAGISGLEGLVRHPDLLAAHVVGGPVAAVLQNRANRRAPSRARPDGSPNRGAGRRRRIAGRQEHHQLMGL